MHISAFLRAILLLAPLALAFALPAEAKGKKSRKATPSAPAPVKKDAPRDTTFDDLFEPEKPSTEQPQTLPAAQPTPSQNASPQAASTTAATSAATSEVVPPVPDTSRTVAERGGLFNLGLIVAPKVGGGLGALTFAGLGVTPLVELELGWSIPAALPRGHDLHIFVATAWRAPTSSDDVTAADPRLPEGSFHYVLTQHEVVATWGGLYRIPITDLPWLRPYAAFGVRTLWSFTTVDGDADGNPFGPYVERAFSVGGYASAGADLYLGPGAVLVELQSVVAGADRYVIRDNIDVGLQLGVGYRFFL